MSIRRSVGVRSFVCCIAVALSAALAACGGGGSAGEPATVKADPPPPTLALMVDSLGRQVPEAGTGRRRCGILPARAIAGLPGCRRGRTSLRGP